MVMNMDAADIARAAPASTMTAAVTAPAMVTTAMSPMAATRFSAAR